MKNQGWMVAITNMMFERTIHGGRTDMMVEVRQLGELAKQVQRNGRPACEDGYVRGRIAAFACEAEGLKYTSLRQLTRQLRGLPPGPEGSVMKLGTTDLNLRIQNFAMELLGPYSQFEYRAPERSIAVNGRIACSRHDAAQLPPAPTKSSTTSLASACSACPRDNYAR